MGYNQHVDLSAKMELVNDMAAKMMDAINKWAILRGTDAINAREVIVDGHKKFDEQISYLKNIADNTCLAFSLHFESNKKRFEEAAYRYIAVQQELETPCTEIIENASNDDEQVETVHTCLTTGCKSNASICEGMEKLAKMLSDSMTTYVNNMRQLLRDAHVIINGGNEGIEGSQNSVLILCQSLDDAVANMNVEHLRLCNLLHELVEVADRMTYLVERAELALNTAMKVAETKRYAV